MTVQADETPMLFAQTGPLNGQQWVVSDDLIIGRDTGADIVVPDRQISRQHARVSNTARGCMLVDLGSKNGTHVNGSGVHGSVYLNDGDVIQIALAQKFVFVSADSTVPLARPSSPGPRGRKGLHLDRRSRRVFVGDRELDPPLSVAQFTVLELLYREAGEVVSRTRLTEAIWGGEDAVEVSDQALDALIRRLRSRLAEIDESHEYILTIRGHGLRLDNAEK
ncbi:MAG TPA: FHA domain-containing protein [Anaerolineales bacterium]|nr:FHA domain-containing protein [Anaerolineales bacterium]